MICREVVLVCSILVNCHFKHLLAFFPEEQILIIAMVPINFLSLSIFYELLCCAGCFSYILFTSFNHLPILQMKES